MSVPYLELRLPLTLCIGNSKLWFVDKRKDIDHSRFLNHCSSFIDINPNKQELRITDLYFFSLQESLRKENSILDIQLESAKLELAFIQEKFQ